MLSIFDEILKLRGNKFFEIDYDNSNRYRIILKEQDGSKTAYYFSCPIYNNKTKKLIDMKFHQKNKCIYNIGSDAQISYGDEIKLMNEAGYCIIKMQESVLWENARKLKCGNDYIYPTINGFIYKRRYNEEQVNAWELKVDKLFFETCCNNKCFYILRENFIPFVTVSCIGCTDSNENVIAPAIVDFKKITDCSYQINITSSNKNVKWIMFEVNLYESKCFQDTTVESANPTINNAFGSMGFIGDSKEFGEQWLYTKPNIRILGDIIDKHIVKVKMHLPQLNNNIKASLTVFKLVSRFCSFGTSWNNKIKATTLMENSVRNNKYQSIDITKIIIDDFGKLVQLDGFVLRTKSKKGGLCVISTGDSYYRPQIWEINYK